MYAPLPRKNPFLNSNSHCKITKIIHYTLHGPPPPDKHNYPLVQPPHPHTSEPPGKKSLDPCLVTLLSLLQLCSGWIFSPSISCVQTIKYLRLSNV